MKQVIVVCPKCGTVLQFKNYWDWVWSCPFHYFGKRKIKCFNCGYKGYVKKEK